MKVSLMRERRNTMLLVVLAGTLSLLLFLGGMNKVFAANTDFPLKDRAAHDLIRAEGGQGTSYGCVKLKDVIITTNAVKNMSDIGIVEMIIAESGANVYTQSCSVEENRLTTDSSPALPNMSIGAGDISAIRSSANLGENGVIVPVELIFAGSYSGKIKLDVYLEKSDDNVVVNDEEGFNISVVTNLPGDDKFLEIEEQKSISTVDAVAKNVARINGFVRGEPDVSEPSTQEAEAFANSQKQLKQLKQVKHVGEITDDEVISQPVGNIDEEKNNTVAGWVFIGFSLAMGVIYAIDIGRDYAVIRWFNRKKLSKIGGL